MAGGLQGLRLRALSVGGLQGDGGQVEQGFRGCVQVWGWGGLWGCGTWDGNTAWGCGHGALGCGGGQRDVGMCHRERGHAHDMGVWAEYCGYGHRNVAQGMGTPTGNGDREQGRGMWAHGVGVWAWNVAQGVRMCAVHGDAHKEWGQGTVPWGWAQGCWHVGTGMWLWAMGHNMGPGHGPGDTGTCLVLQGVRVGTTGSAVMLEVATAVQVNVEGGCALPDPCDSGPCPPHSYCSDDWDSFSCSCHPGECQQGYCVPRAVTSA